LGCNPTVTASQEFEQADKPQDIATLREDAQEAELEGDLELAEHLWTHLLAVSPADPKALKSLKRVWGKGQSENKKPAPLTPLSEPEVELRSEGGVDYTRLRNLLAERKWKEADKETTIVMLKAASREEGFLSIEDIEKFPCTDLRTIDQLWVKHSLDHFGFSVQKRIWEEVGGKVDYETEEKLCKHVGWMKDDHVLRCSELTFSTQAPLGHLPYKVMPYDFGNEIIKATGIHQYYISYLVLRLITCKI